jgi:hypothetical protein
VVLLDYKRKITNQATIVETKCHDRVRCHVGVV